jgi:transcription termination factor Rho
MRTDTIKQTTINEVKKVLKKNKKFYTSSDFPFLQIINFYITYQGRVMNQYLRQRGFVMIKAKELGSFKSNEKHSIRGNRNIWISAKNYINYKMRTHDKN